MLQVNISVFLTDFAYFEYAFRLNIVLLTGKLFAKLDYCGIAFLTVGSFVPWLYYSFYCSYTPKVAGKEKNSVLWIMKLSLHYD